MLSYVYYGLGVSYIGPSLQLVTLTRPSHPVSLSSAVHVLFLSITPNNPNTRFIARALLLKRHGDAYNRTPTAYPKYTSKLPHDPLKGLLCLTDSVLLYLYAYWCDEQWVGRVRTTPYAASEPLRDMVRKGWEAEMRREVSGGGVADEDRRERARGMAGLM
jgi:hypothetical protein